MGRPLWAEHERATVKAAFCLHGYVLALSRQKARKSRHIVMHADCAERSTVTIAALWAGQASSSRMLRVAHGDRTAWRRLARRPAWRAIPHLKRPLPLQHAQRGMHLHMQCLPLLFSPAHLALLGLRAGWPHHCLLILLVLRAWCGGRGPHHAIICSIWIAFSAARHCDQMPRQQRSGAGRTMANKGEHA